MLIECLKEKERKRTVAYQGGALRHQEVAAAEAKRQEKSPVSGRGDGERSGKAKGLFFRLAYALAVLSFPCALYGASVKPAVQEAFGVEGGRNCRHDDPGNRRPDGTWGCTMYGFSPRVYGDRVPDSLDAAARMYERDFWKTLRLGELRSQTVANAVFLAAINQGEPTWARKIQEAINLSNDYGQDLKVDGIIGPKTIEAANRCDQVELYVNIIILQGERYQSLVKRNPALRGWYREWMYRMKNGVRKAVLDHERRSGDGKNALHSDLPSYLRLQRQREYRQRMDGYGGDRC